MTVSVGRWLGVCAALSFGVSRAQMDVELTLDQSVYIVGEPVRADVRIINRATTPFGVGPEMQSGQNGLCFEVRDNAHESLSPLRPKTPMLAELMLLPGESQKLAYELDEWYPMRRTGRYIISAMVRRDDRRYDSTSRSIDIVPGLEIRSAIQLFADRPNEQRKLALVYWVRKQAEFLFLRVTDSPGERTWTTIELGRLLRTTPPTIAITPEGEVTVVHRATQDIFLKTRVRSTAAGIDLLGQDRVIDPQTLATMKAQLLLAGPAKEEKKSHWWWPFGGGGDADKNPDSR